MASELQRRVCSFGCFLGRFLQVKVGGVASVKDVEAGDLTAVTMEM